MENNNKKCTNCCCEKKNEETINLTEKERKIKAGEVLSELLRLTDLDVDRVEVHLEKDERDYIEIFSKSSSNYSVKQSIECDSVYAMILDTCKALKYFE